MATTINSSQAIRFHLNISSDQYLAYYQGSAKDVLVRSTDNKSIKFPANTIRPFLTHSGIVGLFEIRFDENNKFIDIQKVNS